MKKTIDLKKAWEKFIKEQERKYGGGKHNERTNY